MKVSIDDDDLVALLDRAALVYDPDAEEVLERVLDAVKRARRHRDRPRLELELRHGEILGFGPGDDARNRWDAVRRIVEPLKALIPGPADVARADAVQSYARDVFDGFGLTLREEDTLYVVLVTLGLAVELASNAHKREQVSDEVFAGIAHVAQSLAIALLPYFPPEAT